MDFDLSEEQQLLQDGVARLLADRYGFEQRRAVIAQPDGWSRTLWRQFAELGLLALPFSEADGGLGGGAIDLMLVMEAFGRHLVVEPYLANIVLAGGCLRHAANAAQRAALLPAVIAGERLLALAHVERSARYEISHVRRARGAPGTTGSSMAPRLSCSTAMLPEQLLVSARTAGEPSDREGLALFLVDADSPASRGAAISLRIARARPTSHSTTCAWARTGCSVRAAPRSACSSRSLTRRWSLCAPRP